MENNVPTQVQPILAAESRSHAPHGCAATWSTSWARQTSSAFGLPNKQPTSALHGTTLHGTTLHGAALHGAALHVTALHRAALLAECSAPRAHFCGGRAASSKVHYMNPSQREGFVLQWRFTLQGVRIVRP